MVDVEVQKHMVSCKNCGAKAVWHHEFVHDRELGTLGWAMIKNPNNPTYYLCPKCYKDYEKEANFQ